MKEFMAQARRKIAMVLCFAMIFTMMPMYTSAATLSNVLTDSSKKPKIELVYLEYADGYYDEYDEDEAAYLVKDAEGKEVDGKTVVVEEKTVPLLDEGDEFFIGIRLSGLDNMKTVANGNYLANIGINITYDANCVEPEGKDVMKNLLATRLGAAKGSSAWRKLLQKYTFTDNVNIDTTTHTIVSHFQAKNLSTTTVSSTDGYPGTNCSDAIYIGLVKMTVKEGALEQNVKSPVKFNKTDADFINFGVSGLTNQMVAYNNDADNDMLAVFDYDDSVEVFPVTSTVTYDANGGSFAENVKNTQKVVQGKSLSDMNLDVLSADSLTAPVNTEFGGWYTTKVESEDDLAAATEFTKSSTVNDNMTVYAYWKEKTSYSLTFDPNGGQWGTGDDAVTVAQVATGTAEGNADVSALPEQSTLNKSHDGHDYKFDGWASADGTITGATYAEVAGKVSDETTVYAQWTVKDEDKEYAVKVILDGNGGKFGEATTREVAIFKGDTLDANYPTDEAVTRADYKLQDPALDTEQNGSGTDVKKDTVISDDTFTFVEVDGMDTLTLYAQWIMDEESEATFYTVKFDGNGGTVGNPTELKIKENDKIGAYAPNDFTHSDNKVFDYWATDTAGTNRFDVENTEISSAVVDESGELTLYVIWKEAMTITLHPGSGTFSDNDQTKVLENQTPGANIALSSINNLVTPPEGYSFDGKWNTKANGTGTEVTDGTAIAAGMEDLYAVYTVTDPEKQVTITFDGNGADVEADPTSTIVAAGTAWDSVITPTQPTKTGYEFAGWYDQVLGGTEYTAGKAIPSEVEGNKMTLYAHWIAEEDADKIEVKFYRNDDAEVQLIDTVDVVKNAEGKYVLNMAYPEVERNGYSKQRWENTDKSLWVRVASGAAYEPEKDLEATADLIKEDDFLDLELTAATDFYMVWRADPFVTLSDLSQAYNTKGHKPSVDSVMSAAADGVALTGLGDASFKFRDAKNVDGVFSATEPINVGTYDIEVELTGDTTADHPVVIGAVTLVGNPQLDITAYQVTLKLKDGIEQEKSISSATESYALEMTYVSSGDNGIDDELAKLTVNRKNYKVEGDAISAIDGDPTGVGLYAVYPELSGDNKDNFVIAGYQDVAAYNQSEYTGITDGLFAKLELKSAVSLTDIVVKQGAGSGENPYLDTVQLYTTMADGALSGETAFAAGTYTYYGQVKTGNQVQITFTGTLPNPGSSVTLNGIAMTLVDNGDGTYTYTGTLPNVADQTKGNSGFDNEVKIVLGADETADNTYVLKLRQLRKAEIKLAAGNSPYGEIMKDDTVWRTYTFVDDDADYNNKSDAEKKAKWQELAKASFAENDAFIDESLTPVSMSAQRTAGVKYGIAAWLNMVNPAAPSEEELAEAAKADVNMDRNDATIFVYNYESFVAPVVEAVDSAGNTVQLNGSVVVNRIKNTGVSKTYLDLVDNAVEESTIQIESGKLNEALTTGTYVRPDKYEIKYSYTDANSGETITATRYMVVLGRFADTTDLDNIAGGNDLGYFNEIIKYSGEPVGFVKGENITDSPHRVFSIRVADTNYDNLVNGNDNGLIDSIIAAGGTLELTEYYAKLPTATN